MILQKNPFRVPTGDDKIIEEQALVAAYIRRSLDAAGLKDFEEKGPRTVAAANLVHLRSDFFVDLAEGDKALLGDLLDRLNPTSAVLGMPKQPALAFLAANEGYDRDYYTGFLGRVDAKYDVIERHVLIAPTGAKSDWSREKLIDPLINDFQLLQYDALFGRQRTTERFFPGLPKQPGV